MYIEQLYTGCLAQAAYYLESDGEAAIIDPLREPQPYLELAKMRRARIKYVFETHFHADFVSGHIEIARLTGASIVFGPRAKPAYPAVIALDGERFQLGKITIEVLHTPGHTIESSCFLVRDEEGRIHCIFTGDTLFVGDVGRPDLLSGNLSKEELASLLFDSLNDKIKTLPNEVIVYPGHGAGSACGKNIGKESSSTIGIQKKLNYALADMNRDEFTRAVTSNLPHPPAYFFKDAAINSMGYGNYDDAFTKAHKKLSVTELQNKIKQGALLIDTRETEEFGKAFIPGSWNVGLSGDFAVWIGTLVPFDSNIVLLTAPGKEAETIRRLLRVGYENIEGYLSGGIETWKSNSLKTEEIKTLKPTEAERLIESDQFILVDVRRPAEAAKCRVKQSVLLPLAELPAAVKKLDANRKYLVYCAGGYRSMIAVAMLKAAGIREVYNVEGGINKIRFEKPLLIEE